MAACSLLDSRPSRSAMKRAQRTEQLAGHHTCTEQRLRDFAVKNPVVLKPSSALWELPLMDSNMPFIRWTPIPCEQPPERLTSGLNRQIKVSLIYLGLGCRHQDFSRKMTAWAPV